MAALDEAAIDHRQIIAALRRELDERTTERDEALAQQLATSEILGVISRSPTDTQPVFEAIVVRAAALCEAEFSAVARFEDGLLHLVAVHSMSPDETAAFHSLFPRPPTRNFAMGRAFVGARPVHFADVLTEFDYDTRTIEVLQSVAKYRSFLGVPIFWEGRPIGVIGCGRREVRPFTAAQIDLVKTFAEQAAIAIENVRLFGELEIRNRDLGEALEQQTATAEVLQVINSSPGDLAPVFDAMLERATRLCEVDIGTLWTYDGEMMHAAAIRGAPPDLTEFLRKGPHCPAKPQLRMLGGERIVQIADVTTTEAYRDRDPVPRAIADLGGVRTLLIVPLRKDDTVLGNFAIYRCEVRPFTDKQIALLESFATQAVIAMENARLLTETREALEQQTATAEVLQIINSSPGDLTPVFDAMLEKAMRLCEATHGHVWRFDGELLHAVAARGDPHFVEWLQQHRSVRPIRGSAADRVVRGERLVHVADRREEDAYIGDPIFRGLVDTSGVRTSLSVALCRDETLLGMINVYRQEVRSFSDAQIALLQNFAEQAVIAIENARLITETREALEQQTATAEVLGVINSSPGDLAPVFEAILDKAHTLCGATLGSLFLFDGELFRAAAVHGYPEDLAQRLREGVILSATPQLLDDSVRWVHNPDLTQIDAPTARAVSGRGGVRTNLMLPLRKDGKLLGAISCNRQEVRPFRDKEIALLQNFAGQAVIAMENARLLTETREALDQQTATAEVLQVINASPGDLAPVFDAMLEKAMRLCDASMGVFTTFDGNRFKPAISRGVPPRYAEYLATTSDQPSPGGTNQRVLGGENVAHVTDLTETLGYRSGHPWVRALVDFGHARSLVTVALRKDSALLGTITLYRQDVRPFSDKETALLQNFAAQAVIAMENARLLGELHARTDELTRSVAELQALEEVLRAVNSSLDLDTVLATIVSRAAQLSQADEGTIYEFDEAEEVFVPKSAFGMSAERVEALRERRIKLGETHLGRSALLRAPVYVQDVQQDLSVPHAARTLPGIHAVLAVPLLRDEKVVGGLVIRRRTEAGFAPTIPTLLRTFAGQAVLAIENARLFQELGRRGEEARRARTAAEAALADLHRAQDRLIQAEKMASLGQLTAGIAHEIKNPLNFVNNFAGLSVELLEELKETAAPAIAGLAEDERADVDEIVGMLTGNLEKIAEHGRRADGIVKSMLEHSRGGAGERREVDLNGLVEEALNLAYHGARAQDQNFNIILEREFGPAIAAVELVPQDMTRVLLNLIGNGFYAATKRRHDGAEPHIRPTLKVATRDCGAAVEIRIRDNGAGIPPEIRDKLFQPFFTTKPTGEGTGLGLSISWDIVTQQHGGTIEVDSRVGEFTEFTIHLPRS